MMPPVVYFIVTPDGIIPAAAHNYIFEARKIALQHPRVWIYRGELVDTTAPLNRAA
jgi:hypothetical protein